MDPLIIFSLLVFCLPISLAYAALARPAVHVTANEFEAIGLLMMREGKSQCKSEKVRNRRFKAWFGTTPKYVELLWDNLILSGSLATLRRAEPKHLLWALLFLKQYSREEDHAAQVGGVDEKTFRKWAWFYVHGIAELAPSLVCTVLLHSSSTTILFPLPPSS